MWAPLVEMIAPLIAEIGAFLLREVIVKFLVMGAVYFLVSSLMPFALEYIGPYIGLSNLTTYLNAIPAEMWYFLDLLRFDYGLPLVFGAYVARFSVRRMPGIG